MIRKVFGKGRPLFLLMISVVFIKCETSHVKRPQIEYKNDTIVEVLMNFVEVASERTQNKVVTVDLKNVNDSSIVTIADTYPNLKYTTYVGLDSIKGHQIYFVGSTNKFIYDIGFKGAVPKQIIEVNKKLSDPRFPPPSYDPIQWILYFKHGQLVGGYPDTEISKYFK